MSPLGDCAITVKLGDQVDVETHTKVRVLSDYLTQHPFNGLIEFIPAFTSVTIVYDPLLLFVNNSKESPAGEIQYPYDLVRNQLITILERLNEGTVPEPKVVDIPVCYGGEFGVDLVHVAEINGLSTDEVIRIHSGGQYLVYMLGFAPGFPYLGGMDKRIAAPRKESPRLAIPPGTVGIAGEQTGIYPIQTPGGWQLIGRTPLSLFLPDRQPPTLLEAGNLIRFYPITREQYDRWGE
ncbi:5-oxoprolinase subunit PxpB [Paenibacillus sp. NPDC056579]|uniref:5-oxoprolinase subunit PxpB n=1 Tax=unclassified Paenibacillus TaxID=185978 RepID=UPI001EF7CA0D|nr:5-oxoprolinase subunit PxpB [Paenibacillus sp. H1-7]ULL15875.1 allophanate hydrolase subunit 1 [Paenibacillus sp. H1-7]